MFKFGRKKDFQKEAKDEDNDKVNRHFIFIEAPFEYVAPEIIKWGEADWWPKKCPMRFIRTVQDEVAIGTRYRLRLKGLLGPILTAEVTGLDPEKFIERTFIKGMFVGTETVNFEFRYNGTRVDYELKYQIRGLLNKIWWPLVFRKKHDENIKLILSTLKNYLEDKYKQEEDKRLGDA